MALASFPTAKTVEIPEIPTKDSLTLPAAETVLLIVDMQNDFVRPEGTLYVEAASKTVKPIADLLKRAREKGVHIAYTQDTHMEQDPEFEIWPPHCIQNTKGWEIIDELATQKDELILQKSRYDSFYGTSLDHYMTRVWEAKNLIIVGTVANICVGQTAASAGLRWMNVITPADGISALTEFDQASALRQISMLYNGAVLKTAENIDFTA